MYEIGKKYVIREPPSVPFLWEVKPGIPKKDWKPEFSSLVSHNIPKTPPLKFIASVPFLWEEKPGTPLPDFSHVSVDHVASSSGFSFATKSVHYDNKDKESSGDNVDEDSSSYSDDSESITTSMGLEAFSFETDHESFISVPSLLANCLVTSPPRISTAIPIEENSLSPASSENSSICSYATGMSTTTSLVGASFLECLFPLYPPKSGFLENDGHSENVSSTTLVEVKARGLDYEEYTTDMMKKPPTLGELIMMSRRRSCRRKAAQMKKWDLSKKITRKQGFGCFTFVTTSSMIEGLLKRKYFPSLKLV